MQQHLIIYHIKVKVSSSRQRPTFDRLSLGFQIVAESCVKLLQRVVSNIQWHGNPRRCLVSSSLMNPIFSQAGVLP